MWGVAQQGSAFIRDFSLSHAIDVAIMWFLLYQVYIRFRGTQAMRLLVRVFGVWLAYLAARAAGLYITSFLLWAIWIAVLILFLINFHGEIQRIFFQLNPVRRVSVLLRRAMRIRLPEESATTIAASVFALAGRGMGAIVIIERRDAIEALLRGPGEEIGATLRPALLETIFTKGAPYHDGAAVVRGEKITRVGCVLPLSDRTLPPAFGTRHRAAVGMTERSDALAVVVSEERGEVTCMEGGGHVQTMESEEALAAWLTARLHAPREGAQAKGRVSLDLLTENWKPKLVALAAVVFLSTLSGQGRQNPQNFFPRLERGAEAEFHVPLHYYNLPSGVALPGDAVRSVKIRLRGNRDLLHYIDAQRLRVNVNLIRAVPGVHDHTLTGRDVDLPDGLAFVGAAPATIRLDLEKAQTPGPMTRSQGAAPSRF